MYNIITVVNVVYSQSHVQLFCNSMDCRLPDSSVHGIFQIGILEWVAISFSRGSSQPRDQTQVSCIAADSLPSELPGKPTQICIYYFFKFFPQLGCYTIVSRVPCAIQQVLVTNCIYSSAYTSVSNSLTIPSSYPSLYNHKFLV